MEDVLEKALVGAAVGAISVIIWLDRRRRKRKAEKKAASEKKAAREQASQRAFSKAPREDDEEGARKFARKTVPDIE